MIKADRRIDSATCLPLSAINCNFSGARASLPAKLVVTETKGAHSSVGQSYRLITGWSLVRVQVGPPSFRFKKDQEVQRENSEWNGCKSRTAD
jgi:hypothetical protein